MKRISLILTAALLSAGAASAADIAQPDERFELATSANHQTVTVQADKLYSNKELARANLKPQDKVEVATFSAGSNRVGEER